MYPAARFQPTRLLGAALILLLVWAGEVLPQEKTDVARALVHKADSLRQERRFKEAELAYRQALVLQKDSVPALIGLGRIFYERRKWKAAQEWFRRALAIEPENQEARAFFNNPHLQTLLRQADSLRVLKKYHDAEELFKEALDIDENSVPALLGLARIAHAEADWDGVKKWTRRVRNLEPENEEVRHLLTTHPRPKALPHIEKGEQYLAAGEYKKAKKAFRKALKIYAGSLRVFRGLARLGWQERDWGEVKEWYGRLLEVEPTDLEANYYRGIAYRETGKVKALLLKKRDFSISEKHFAKVMSVDSTYADVLYQRALLERWRRNFPSAVVWATRQLRLKPNLTHVNVGLYRLYRMFVVRSDESRMRLWRRRHPDDWATFALAERLRLSNKLDEAEHLFQQLLEKESPQVNDTMLYLSLVKLYLQQGREENANAYFTLALERLETDLDAQFWFEACKYIFTDEELAAFRTLDDPAAQKAFFEKFWTRRSPLPVARVNPRAMTHFRRLVFAERNFWYDGLRTWATNPDKVGYLRFPKVYEENQEFNDKGVVFIRHGPPDEVAKTAGQMTSNESWHYFKRPDRPEFIFHFLKADRLAVGNNWKLAPFLPDVRMYQDRAGWDPKLDRLLMASSQPEINSLLNQLADESYVIVKEAMATDTHTWEKGTQELPMPHYTAFFRGKDGKTRLEFYYGFFIPDLISEEMTDPTFEYGVGVYDRTWRLLDKSYAEGNLVAASNQGRNNIFIQRYRTELDPGAYQLVFYATRPGSKKIGGDNLKIEVPDLSGSDLIMSDLVLALDIGPATPRSAFVTGEMEVVPNPTRTYRQSNPVRLYFELYNLETDSRQLSRYEMETVMKRLKRGGLFGGGKKEVISIVNRREVAGTTSQEVNTFDVSKLEDGEYELTVKVRDLNSGQKVEKSIELMLRKARS